MDNDPTQHMMPPRLNHHHTSLMSRTPGEGLYNNLYEKDNSMGLMRKLMSFDEFTGNNIGQAPNNGNDMNGSATKQQQFHPFPPSNGASGLFNGKFSNTSNFPFLFEGNGGGGKQQQSATNNMRHEGLLKPCYDFPSKSAADGLDESYTVTAGGLRKQQLTSTTTSSHGFTSGGFNQFSHDPLFGANNHHHQHHLANFPKLNEINNNNSSASNGMVGGGNGIINSGIVIKTENGINDYHHNSAGTNNSSSSSASNNSKANENLCSRSSNAMNAKTEPNEFKSSSCKGNLDNSHHPHHDDDDGNERKSLAADESADGFTQL